MITDLEMQILDELVKTIMNYINWYDKKTKKEMIEILCKNLKELAGGRSDH